jgi:hypothetical protein
MEIKDGFKRWDNPVPMRCGQAGIQRQGEEIFPGGNSGTCGAPAHFIEVQSGEVSGFFCYEHGRRAGAR